MKHNFRNLILRPNGCSRSPIRGGSPLGFHGILWDSHQATGLSWTFFTLTELKPCSSWLKRSWVDLNLYFLILIAGWLRMLRYGTPMMKVETSIFGQHWLSFKVHPRSVPLGPRWGCIMSRWEISSRKFIKIATMRFCDKLSDKLTTSWLARMIPTWIWKNCLKLVVFPKSIGLETWLKYNHLGVYRYTMIYPIFGRSHMIILRFPPANSCGDQPFSLHLPLVDEFVWWLLVD